MVVRRLFGPTDRPGDGYEYAQMSEAGYHAPMVPTTDAAPSEVVLLANELAGVNAIDEGNGHVLDRIVRAWGEHWCDQELQQHNARASVLQRHALNARAWHDRCDDHITQLEEELRYTELQLTRLDAAAPPRRRAPRPRTPTEDET
jgi:hypothetical protein